MYYLKSFFSSLNAIHERGKRGNEEWGEGIIPKQLLLYQVWEHVPEGRHSVMSTIDLPRSYINLSFLRIAHRPEKHSHFCRL